MTDAKNKILARRARFMTAALASAGLAVSSSTLPACSEGNTEPQVCLSPAFDATADTHDATSDTSDTGPQPCLTPPEDTRANDTSDGATDTATGDTKPTDATPDAPADTGPTPCLTPPLDGG